MKALVKKDKAYTYRDYVNWPSDEKWEIIDSVAYNMTPAPKVKHQITVWNICRAIDKDPKGLDDCTAFSAPTDVVLDEWNVVQPDVFVVCDKNKITEDNIRGAPDLVIEVVSPSTEVKDRREKKKLYERSGVKEYVIVFPHREYVERYLLLEAGHYSQPEIYNGDETLTLTTLGIDLNLPDIFE